jgi:alkylated DNA nucleotide flippase Atl1
MKNDKSWCEELFNEEADLPRVEQIPEELEAMWGKGTVVIPGPWEIEELVALIPEGKVVTVEELQTILARRHGTDTACPRSISAFTRLTSEAMEELASEGNSTIAPHWRVLRKHGELDSQFPGGIENQKTLLENEGHKIVPLNGHFYVEGYKKALFSFDEEELVEIRGIPSD